MSRWPTVHYGRPPRRKSDSHGSGISPAARVRFAKWLLAFVLAGWAATHILMVVTKPPEASWVFHVLLAISWGALALTALDIIVSTDVRREIDDGPDSRGEA